MIRTFFAAALVAAFGITGITAASAKRSKDERVAWFQTVHESKQPWQDMMNKARAVGSKAVAPAASTGSDAPKAAGPTR